MHVIDRLVRNSNMITFVFYTIFVVVFGVTYFLHNQGYSVDDSYITYRYASNLEEGYGLVFNVGEHYYGTTAAGYAVLLAGGSALASTVASMFGASKTNMFDVPNVSVAVSSIALMTVALLLPVIAQAKDDWRRWVVCVFGSIVLFLSYPFNEVAGHETYPFLAVALLGTVIIGYSRAYIFGSFVFAIAATFRPDAILMAGVVPAVDWLRSGQTIPEYIKSRQFISFTAVYAVVMVLWFSYLAFHFGSLMPGTMDAKKAQVLLGYWPQYSLATITKYLLGLGGFVSIFLVIVGVVSFFREGITVGLRNMADMPQNFVAGTWVLYAVIGTGAYFSFNVTFWRWYGVPILFSILLVSFVGWLNLVQWADISCRWFKNDAPVTLRFILRSFPLVVLVFLSTSQIFSVSYWARSKNVNPHISAYSEIVDFIRKDSPKGAIIQMAEPGSFGYHLGPKYKIIDELGLITPGVAQALLEKNYTWAINKWHPKYLICSWKGKYSSCFHGLQVKDYELVGEFNRDFWVPRIKSGAKLFRLKTK